MVDFTAIGMKNIKDNADDDDILIFVIKHGSACVKRLYLISYVTHF